MTPSLEASLEKAVSEIYTDLNQPYPTPNKFPKWKALVLKPTLNQLLQMLIQTFPVLQDTQVVEEKYFSENVCFVEIAEVEMQPKSKNFKVPRNLFFLIRSPAFLSQKASKDASDSIYVFYTNTGNQKKKWSQFLLVPMQRENSMEALSTIKNALKEEYFRHI